MALADLRKEYTQRRLDEGDVAADPFTQFGVWFDEALGAQLHEPNALTLCTVGADGRPAGRVVLLKGFDARGFVFYTNYTSRKGRELAANPWACMVFYWGELERQVRIEGLVAMVAPEESDAYFDSRPRGSRLGALVSQQSAVIAHRALLEQRMAELEAQYAGDTPIARPAHWGGYRLAPTSVEFWQGRPSRLHDRIRYQQGAGGAWLIERLSP
jgi:pyridoxamine 5'-phosphate oxidase